LHVPTSKIAIRKDGETKQLRFAYPRERIHEILGDALRPGEIDAAVYGYNPPAYVDYRTFDAERSLEQYLGGMLTRDLAHAGEVERYRKTRMAEVREAVANGIQHHDLRDLVHAPVPAHLRIIKRAVLPTVRV
jgi:hypothetical protein